MVEIVECSAGTGIRPVWRGLAYNSTSHARPVAVCHTAKPTRQHHKVKCSIQFTAFSFLGQFTLGNESSSRTLELPILGIFSRWNILSEELMHQR